MFVAAYSQRNVGINIEHPSSTFHVVNYDGSRATTIEQLDSSSTFKVGLEVLQDGIGGSNVRGIQALSFANDAGVNYAVYAAAEASLTTTQNTALFGEVINGGIGVRGRDFSGTGLAGQFDGDTYFNGKVGINVSDPVWNFQVHDPNNEVNRMYLTAQSTGSGDTSAIFFAEDDDATYGMEMMYDGLANKLGFYGKSLSNIYGPHILIGRDDGLFEILEGANVGVGNSHKVLLRHDDDSNSSAGVTTSASVALHNGTGNQTVVMYGNSSNDSEGWMALHDKNGNRTIEFDGDYNDAGEIVLTDITGQELITIQAKENTTQGGQIIFRDLTGSITAELDADYAGSGNSRLIIDELEIKGGSDLVEYFNVTHQSVAPGDVVCIDVEIGGQLTHCSELGQKTVVGVISGAKGIKAGMMMSQTGTELDGTHALAISGRVYVKSKDLSIKPGDLLIAGADEGHACKLPDDMSGTGRIIGKALTSNEEGYVLMLIALQ